ncbi:MAG: type II toxin-antitoxin system VapC family toxin [Phycisphaerales bacterium]
MLILIDTNILSTLCHPRMSRETAKWFSDRIRDPKGPSFTIPEISDYELRRKLLHLIRTGKATKESIARLDALISRLGYDPITTGIMRCAADLWASARSEGKSTKAPESLDGDVILAAQAIEAKGQVLTLNRKHLSRYITVLSPEDVGMPREE